MFDVLTDRLRATGIEACAEYADEKPHNAVHYNAVWKETADTMAAALLDKLDKSIEYGRVEQVRKQKAEERIAALEDEVARLTGELAHMTERRKRAQRYAHKVNVRRRQAEAEVARYKGLYEHAWSERGAYEAKWADESRARQQAEVEARYYKEHYELVFEQRNAAERAVREADVVIPLSEEQAEAFKALSESIKNEQRLEAEVERLKVCGNCRHVDRDPVDVCGLKNDDSVPADWMGETRLVDHCHFTPSRWEGLHE